MFCDSWSCSPIGRSQFLKAVLKAPSAETDTHKGHREEVLKFRVSSGCFQGRVSSGCFHGIFRVFSGYFQRVSGYFQGVFRVFFRHLLHDVPEDAYPSETPAEILQKPFWGPGVL